MAGVGHLKRIWKGASRVAQAVQETCDGCHKPTEEIQYSSLDRTILIRDGPLEIDMVLSGLSVVSHVGFKQKKILRSRNRCGTSGCAMQIFNIFGKVVALGHTYFRVVCC